MTYQTPVSDLAYLDYNATAPTRPEALDATLAAMRTVGNASSTHRSGRDASDRVDLARRQIADLLNCSHGEIVFTSGATEANNLALRAAFAAGGKVVTSVVEHPAVLETAKALTAERPGSLVLLPVDEDGLVNLGAFRAALATDEVAIVSLMAANNETGVLTDLAPIVEAAHELGVLVHTDATQLVGRLPIDLAETDVDLLSLSAHKFGGPQGVGALFVRRGISLPYRPLIFGGGQERGWRAGTLNVAGIAGAGAAAEAVRGALTTEASRIAQLRDALEGSLVEQVNDCRINGVLGRRLPGVTSITFHGAPADAVLAAMPDVAASEGSACSSGAPNPSHVLLAMGRSREEADSTVRFSLGYATTPRDIDRAASSAVRAVRQVRAALTAPL
ncbi:cysteine desulfurase family protein [Streptomyces antarcticus]|uniref:cysteine desulfurase family protein n=1 Tax=Streptomyces antarcticus TaxID=2996458 RepID=UPI00227142D8|nr:MULTISPECIES: cysteine desulfurase family protein [unclassified Streptomyces]MCY0940119.1 cysteine desulfurase family protein [Streptomyces sp. H34-AA3]MCZ4080767.1 cysteine desulfurase family protein [Streptomyces sp. H34-S5]